jgi:histidinol dehydrogenase
MAVWLRTADRNFEDGFKALLGQKREQAQDVNDTVATIIAQVRAKGDRALVDLTLKFDDLDLSKAGIKVSEAEIAAARTQVNKTTRDALQLAHDRILDHHKRQLPKDERYRDSLGVELGTRWTPVPSAGLYVPGGTASYPSSVLMNALPARVAGVPRIVMTVPAPKGVLNPLVLVAAELAGVGEIYRLGGAQAIAALAYGTKRIRPVDVITGPGNAWVAEAKRQLFGVVGIDMVAGPSEILVICDGATDPDWIAMDLFSQAEHDEVAQAILLSPDAEFLDRVAASIDRQLPAMPRRDVIKASLASRGALIETRDLEEACEIANRIAPEHLELSVREPERWLDRIRNAGAIFLGPYSSEAVGDYCAGPNHVLPTSRTARFSSPLGVYDFQKRSSVIKLSREGARTLGATAAKLARGEGLTAHARSAEYRMQADR